MNATGSDGFLLLLKGLMRPLVRTMINRGITAPAFYKLLKTVYVDVAYEEFRLDGTAPTDSRVTLLTGVHRRDVRAILSNEDDAWKTARGKSAAFATVLSQWMTRPEYQDDAGHPMGLPRTSDDSPNFETLVREINTDIRPRTILDELMRQELVHESDDGLLRISDGAFSGPVSDHDKLVFFASNVGDHLAAASQNLLSEDAPFLERAVFYNRLSPGSVDQIEQHAGQLAQNMLETLNAQSSRLQQADQNETEPKERYRLGVYFYRESTNAGLDRAKDETGETEN
ncbi:hypothetical protein CEP88_12710 [Roseobacter denitrificans]|uniref:Uncharacterized protein n=1 Tax=Roseobacter denitrificans (strain ATCC 33942 / OCh 114) TaxID=375451 RepID=Q16CU1_ROSDO|nr:DUF6502 family protein [Roseobacter denitrificans]ABG30202.1 hypothetical protein RD1_0495 [Roseobacter denitrificans OCh 114]AVL53389.1 hypothetical protein CEP88_12710 [Roseobacter denitrificans]SFF70570.1 hypothetical protein SAMN05443635_101212 [Roseobacter denitrificans OCh 114]